MCRTPFSPSQVTQIFLTPQPQPPVHPQVSEHVRKAKEIAWDVVERLDKVSLESGGSGGSGGVDDAWGVSMICQLLFHLVDVLETDEGVVDVLKVNAPLFFSSSS